MRTYRPLVTGDKAGDAAFVGADGLPSRQFELVVECRLGSAAALCEFAIEQVETIAPRDGGRDGESETYTRAVSNEMNGFIVKERGEGFHIQHITELLGGTDGKTFLGSITILGNWLMLGQCAACLLPVSFWLFRLMLDSLELICKAPTVLDTQSNILSKTDGHVQLFDVHDTTS